MSFLERALTGGLQVTLALGALGLVMITVLWVLKRLGVREHVAFWAALAVGVVFWLVVFGLPTASPDESRYRRW